MIDIKSWVFRGSKNCRGEMKTGAHLPSMPGAVDNSFFCSNAYELQPLRIGQIAVARNDAGGFSGFRAVPAKDNGLRWEALNPQSIATQAAINGYCAYQMHSAEAEWQPECAVSRRQLAQLVAHRAALLALVPNAPLVKIATLSVSTVLRAVLGDDVALALSTLPRLGLDIGCGRDRQAIQIIINLAEKAGCEQLLDHLVIEPHARNGFINATRWLDDLATPELLVGLAQLACTNTLARDLAAHTKAAVPTMNLSMALTA